MQPDNLLGPRPQLLEIVSRTIADPSPTQAMPAISYLHSWFIHSPFFFRSAAFVSSVGLIRCFVIDEVASARQGPRRSSEPCAEQDQDKADSGRDQSLGSEHGMTPRECRGTRRGSLLRLLEFQLEDQIEEFDGVFEGWQATVVEIRRGVLDSSERECLDPALRPAGIELLDPADRASGCPYRTGPGGTRCIVPFRRRGPRPEVRSGWPSTRSAGRSGRAWGQGAMR